MSSNAAVAAVVEQLLPVLMAGVHESPEAARCFLPPALLPRDPPLPTAAEALAKAALAGPWRPGVNVHWWRTARRVTVRWRHCRQHRGRGGCGGAEADLCTGGCVIGGCARGGGGGGGGACGGSVSVGGKAAGVRGRVAGDVGVDRPRASAWRPVHCGWGGRREGRGLLAAGDSGGVGPRKEEGEAGTGNACGVRGSVAGSVLRAWGGGGREEGEQVRCLSSIRWVDCRAGCGGRWRRRRRNAGRAVPALWVRRAALADGGASAACDDAAELEAASASELVQVPVALSHLWHVDAQVTVEVAVRVGPAAVQVRLRAYLHRCLEAYAVLMVHTHGLFEVGAAVVVVEAWPAPGLAVKTVHSCAQHVQAYAQRTPRSAPRSCGRGRRRCSWWALCGWGLGMTQSRCCLAGSTNLSCSPHMCKFLFRSLPRHMSRPRSSATGLCFNRSLTCAKYFGREREPF